MEKAIILRFLEGRLEGFMNGSERSREMVSITPTMPMISQMEYFATAVSVVKKLISDVEQIKTLSAQKEITGDG